MSINNLMTDTMATREGEAGPSRVEQILSEKPVFLANPGTIVANQFYYNWTNSVVDLAEHLKKHGGYRQSLDATGFGGTGALIIQNYTFAGTFWLHLSLPAVPANTFLPRGWGLASLNSMDYTLGASNVQQPSLSNKDMWHVVMQQCETEKKRERLMRWMGEEITDVQAVGTINHAYIPIPLPFSNINALTQKLPFDTSTLGTVITVNLQFEQVEKFMGGTGRDAFASSISNKFLTNETFLVQIELMDRSLSIERPLKLNPDMKYAYPFLHYGRFTDDFEGSSSDERKVTVSGIINADLVGLIFSVVQTDRLTSKSSGTSALSPYATDKLQNVVVEYNGTVIYRAPGTMYDCYILDQRISTNLVPYSQRTGSGGTSPFITEPVDSSIINVPLVRKEQHVFGDHFQNGIRITKNTINITFNTEYTEDYRFFMTYVYNAVYVIQSQTSALVLS